MGCFASLSMTSVDTPCCHAERSEAESKHLMPKGPMCNIVYEIKSGASDLGAMPARSARSIRSNMAASPSAP